MSKFFFIGSLIFALIALTGFLYKYLDAKDRQSRNAAIIFTIINVSIIIIDLINLY